MAQPTYFSDSVRIVSTGSALEDCLIVQWYSEVATEWIEARRFEQSDDYCCTNAKAFASDLATHLWQLSQARKQALAA